jgi:hypothetical protein
MRSIRAATSACLDRRERVALAQSAKLRLGNVMLCPMAEAQQSLEDLAAGRVIGRQVPVA